MPVIQIFREKKPEPAVTYYSFTDMLLFDEGDVFTYVGCRSHDKGEFYPAEKLEKQDYYVVHNDKIYYINQDSESVYTVSHASDKYVFKLENAKAEFIDAVRITIQE